MVLLAQFVYLYTYSCYRCRCSFSPLLPMFNPDFYPTPDAVIEKMIAPLYRTYMGYPESSFFGPRRGQQEQEMKDFPYATVLDPSAGSGAILDYVGKVLDQQARGGIARDKKLYCFETDATLQATLQGKNYRLLGYDFLKYSGDMPLSCIVMNPPFSCGDAHVLHAYSILQPQGQLVALVNSETLRNPCTRTRQHLLNLIEQIGGTVEELGSCFKDSERTTDVEVSIIRLQKPEGADSFSFNWQNKSRERDFDTSRENTRELAGRDVIGNMLTQYDCLREQFMALLRAIDGIKHFGQGLTDTRGCRDAWRIARDVIENLECKRGEGYRQQYLTFTEEMRQQIWGVVLKKVNIQKFMTNAVRENFAKYSTQTGYLDFTRENVFQLISMVLDNTGNILEVAVGQLFDTFTQYHHENRCHVEGWKTNSRYKVNRKIILPNWVHFDGEYANKFEVDYRNRDRYEDVDKVLSYLAGEKYESICTISDALTLQFQRLGRVGSGTFDNVCESLFFKIRFFKKGTIHLEFLDSHLHEEFNLRACAGKQWLPAEEQQAYQRRKASPFPKAKPAPGTDLAALVGNGEREQVLQKMLGSSSDVAQVTSAPEAAPASRVSEWAEAEEAQVVAEVVAEVVEVEALPAEAEPVASSPEVVAEVVAEVVVKSLPLPTPPRRASQRPATPRPNVGQQMGLFADAPALLAAA